MEQESIQCDGCSMWLHQHCIHMSLTAYAEFSLTDHFNFFCLQCSTNRPADDTYNFLAALARIAARAPDIDSMRQQAESERNLLSFYSVSLLPVCVPSVGDVVIDNVSVVLLQRYSPWILQQFMPVTVGADGNCFFRAVSVALYGTEKAHAQLRLLSVIEALLCHTLYDSSSPDYYAPYVADADLILSDYNKFIFDLVKNGSYCDMLTVLVCSTVVQRPIQTRWPIPTRDGRAAPTTKRVTGRGVGLQPTSDINILWTCGAVLEPPVINHFVPLLPVSVVSSCVEVPAGHTDSEDSDQATPIVDTQAADIDGPDSNENIAEQHQLFVGNEMSGHFMSVTESFNLLFDDSIAVCDTVPTGVKENVFFKVRMQQADERQNKFWDDCGAWLGTHGKKKYHLPSSYKEINRQRDGTYAERRCVHGKMSVVPIEPQPCNVFIRGTTKWVE